MAEITFKLGVITPSVVKITFVVVYIFFKVAVLYHFTLNCVIIHACTDVLFAVEKS